MKYGFEVFSYSYVGRINIALCLVCGQPLLIKCDVWKLRTNHFMMDDVWELRLDLHM